MADFLDAGAAFNTERTHRYRLWRVWDVGRPRLGWLMMNPSTADESTLDPTLRRCVGFARSWGCGGIEAFNVATCRATDPKDLVAADRAGVDVWHREERDRAILRALRSVRMVVVAWGACPLVCAEAPSVARMIAALDVDVVCLGRTRQGHPRHPLYLPGDTRPIAWEASDAP